MDIIKESNDNTNLISTESDFTSYKRKRTRKFCIMKKKPIQMYWKFYHQKMKIFR